MSAKKTETHPTETNEHGPITPTWENKVKEETKDRFESKLECVTSEGVSSSTLLQPNTNNNKKLNIVWTRQVVGFSRTTEEDVCKWLLPRGRWGALRLYPDLLKRAQECEDAKEKTKMTVQQLSNIRVWYLRNHILCCFHTWLHQKAKWRRDSGAINLLDMAMRYDVSPGWLARHIYQRPLTTDEKAWDITEVSPEEESTVRQASLEFERDIGLYLEKLGIVYQSENDQRLSQSDTSRRTSTPDFLFPEPVCVRGHWIHWIEVKNFCGVDVPIVSRKILKQADHYVQLFGPGAILFRYGCGARLAKRFPTSVTFL